MAMTNQKVKFAMKAFYALMLCCFRVGAVGRWYGRVVLVGKILSYADFCFVGSGERDPTRPAFHEAMLSKQCSMEGGAGRARGHIRN